MPYAVQQKLSAKWESRSQNEIDALKMRLANEQAAVVQLQKKLSTKQTLIGLLVLACIVLFVLVVTS